MPMHSGQSSKLHTPLGKSKWTLHVASPDIQSMASDHATYMHYHRSISRLRLALESKHAVPDSEQRRLLHGGSKAEQCQKKSIATALDTISRNADFFFGAGGAVDAICNRVDDLRKFSDPASLTPEARQAVDRTGITPQEFTHYFNLFFGPKKHPHLKECLQGLGGHMESVVAHTRHWVHRSHFPESEAELRRSGIITIHGEDNPVPYIVGAGAVVVGVAVVVASGGTAAGVIPGVIAIVSGTASTGAIVGGAIAAGGAVLLATEAYQDSSGTQDGEWLYKYKGRFSEP